MRSSNLQLAFTLVEMLLTLAIAAVLMSAVFIVISVVARDRLRMGEAYPAMSNAQDRLLELLRRDLVCSRQVQMLPDGKGIEMISFAGIDPKLLAPVDRKVDVRYEVIGDEKHSLLVREQRYLDERVPTKPWREPICDGVARLTMQPIGDSEVFDFRLEYQDSRRTPYERPIVLH